MPPKTDVTTENNSDASANNASSPKTSAPPNVGPTYDRDLVYAPDGKPWREKYHGQKGRVQQLEEEYGEKLEEKATTLQKLKQELEQRQGAVQELTGKLESAGEQLGELQALKDRIPELESKAGRAAKLEAILEYPQLANLQVKDMMTNEEGEEVELLSNPIMSLVESSTLEGEALRAELRRLNKVYQKAGEVPEPQSTSVTDGAAPSPGEQVEQTPEYWQTKAREAHQQAIENPSQREEFLDQMQEFTQKAREAEAKLSS